MSEKTKVFKYFIIFGINFIIIIIRVTHQSHQEPDGRLNTHPQVHGAKNNKAAPMSPPPLRTNSQYVVHDQRKKCIEGKTPKALLHKRADILPLLRV